MKTIDLLKKKKKEEEEKSDDLKPIRVGILLKANCIDKALFYKQCRLKIHSSICLIIILHKTDMLNKQTHQKRCSFMEQSKTMLLLLLLMMMMMMMMMILLSVPFSCSYENDVIGLFVVVGIFPLVISRFTLSLLRFIIDKIGWSLHKTQQEFTLNRLKESKFILFRARLLRIYDCKVQHMFRLG